MAAPQIANYDWHKFNLDSDLALADKSGIDTHIVDLTPFKKHGGKLLYHGWADQAIPPGNTVNFYNNVLAKMGPKQDDWMRLFMVPGMLHCTGGPGTDQFNKMAVLERWRESNEAPQQIVAAHVTNGQVDMTRPLCPYPEVAVYKGVGSKNDAANFSCKARRSGVISGVESRLRRGCAAGSGTATLTTPTALLGCDSAKRRCRAGLLVTPPLGHLQAAVPC